MFARIVFDQRVETWLSLHVAAFAELGGVVKTIVPDNLKAAVVRCAFGVDQQSGLNQSYRELARHYGCQIDPTPPRQPGKKGKVEASVKYVKGNFFKPRDLSDIDTAQREFVRWLREIAGMRIHGVTGRRPLEVFEREEQPALLPLPAAIYEPVVWKRAKVHTDSHISFERRLYSVPWRLIGQEIWVRATPTALAVYAAEKRVATHDRRSSKGRTTHDAHLPPHRVDYRYRTREYWETRAASLGRDVGDYVAEVFDADDVLSQLRTVQAIVTHLERFPLERAQAACRRARHFASYRYAAIKNILRRGLDLEPLPDDDGPIQGSLVEPRFARSPAEFSASTKERSA